MAAKKKQAVPEEIVIEELNVGVAEFYVKGMTPLIYNAMSAKVKGILLFPPPPKGKAEKATTLKHNPLEEYRNSVYRSVTDGPTRLIFPAVAFKNTAVGAIRHVAAGVTMVQMKQLLWVPDAMIDVYGIPELYMSVVRSADTKSTPDVRTRAILPEWCAKVKVQYIRPNLNETALSRLLDAGGLLNGVGDFRQEKGKGNYGQFQIVSEDDCKDLMKSGHMKAQDRALENPCMYDTETAELYNWYNAELTRRGRKQ